MTDDQLIEPIKRMPSPPRPPLPTRLGGLLPETLDETIEFFKSLAWFLLSLAALYVLIVASARLVNAAVIFLGLQRLADAWMRIYDRFGVDVAGYVLLAFLAIPIFLTYRMRRELVHVLDTIWIEPIRQILKAYPLTIRWWRLLFMVLIVWSLTVVVIGERLLRILSLH